MSEVQFAYPEHMNYEQLKELTAFQGTIASLIAAIETKRVDPYHPYQVCNFIYLVNRQLMENVEPTKELRNFFIDGAPVPRDL